MPTPPQAVTIETASPTSPEAVALIAGLDAGLAETYDGASIHGLHAEDLDGDRFVFLLAWADGDAIACGGMRVLGDGVAEVKRMYVVPARRRCGIARLMLEAIEKVAAERGLLRLRLETGRSQSAALALYRSSGYVGIAPYGEYVGDPNSVCFEKTLPERILA